MTNGEEKKCFKGKQIFKSQDEKERFTNACKLLRRRKRRNWVCAIKLVLSIANPTIYSSQLPFHFLAQPPNSLLSRRFQYPALPFVKRWNNIFANCPINAILSSVGFLSLQSICRLQPNHIKDVSLHGWCYAISLHKLILLWQDYLPRRRTIVKFCAGRYGAYYPVLYQSKAVFLRQQSNFEFIVAQRSGLIHFVYWEADIAYAVALPEMASSIFHG